VEEATQGFPPPKKRQTIVMLKLFRYEELGGSEEGWVDETDSETTNCNMIVDVVVVGR
jgi:hypothetical protein